MRCIRRDEVRSGKRERAYLTRPRAPRKPQPGGGARVSAKGGGGGGGRVDHSGSSSDGAGSVVRGGGSKLLNRFDWITGVWSVCERRTRRDVGRRTKPRRALHS